MAFVHIDPNSIESARQDLERLAVEQTDAVQVSDHRDADRRAAEDRVSATKSRSIRARLREILRIDR